MVAAREAAAQCRGMEVWRPQARWEEAACSILPALQLLEVRRDFFKVHDIQKNTLLSYVIFLLVNMHYFFRQL